MKSSYSCLLRSYQSLLTKYNMKYNNKNKRKRLINNNQETLKEDNDNEEMKDLYRDFNNYNVTNEINND